MFKFFKKLAENFTVTPKPTKAEKVFKKTAKKRKPAAPHIIKEARKVLRKKNYHVKHAMENIKPWEKKDFFSVLKGMRKSAAKHRKK
jgi:hypothetical protein|tara:strand:- start:668 stop:928 length:261 start_codon:yes stop_codon:yes gene_type:complete